MEWIDQILGIFGAEVSTGVRFAIAFAGVLLLILVLAWLVKIVSRGFSRGEKRGRVARLAVLEAIAVDQRRRLVLVRRDSTEHLILLGGPSDLVVEQGIHRLPRTQQPRGPQDRADPAMRTRRGDGGTADDGGDSTPRRQTAAAVTSTPSAPAASPPATSAGAPPAPPQTLPSSATAAQAPTPVRKPAARDEAGAISPPSAEPAADRAPAPAVHVRKAASPAPDEGHDVSAAPAVKPAVRPTEAALEANAVPDASAPPHPDDANDPQHLARMAERLEAALRTPVARPAPVPVAPTAAAPHGETAPPVQPAAQPTKPAAEASSRGAPDSAPKVKSSQLFGRLTKRGGE